MSGPAHVLPLIPPEWILAKQKEIMAAAITTSGGTGTPAASRLVRAELARMPMGALSIMRDNHTRVVACRNNVLDHLPSLATAPPPKGWKAGDTWAVVPGVYDPNTNQVVIATVGHGTAAGAHVPTLADNVHGSHNIVMHESFHAVDLGHKGTPRSSSPDFVAARNADLAGLSAYEKQAGGVGRQETYAESAARYYGGDPTDAAQ
ncbi:MAG TPA: hypothetical protein VFO85_07465, partial [Vicinamibacteria bacterium]|nr:hypothetical protein [Vicinamibacteria bacterium]